MSVLYSVQIYKYLRPKGYMLCLSIYKFILHIYESKYCLYTLTLRRVRKEILERKIFSFNLLEIILHGFQLSIKLHWSWISITYLNGWDG